MYYPLAFFERVTVFKPFASVRQGKGKKVGQPAKIDFRSRDTYGEISGAAARILCPDNDVNAKNTSFVLQSIADETVRKLLNFHRFFMSETLNCIEELNTFNVAINVSLII